MTEIATAHTHTHTHAHTHTTLTPGEQLAQIYVRVGVGPRARALYRNASGESEIRPSFPKHYPQRLTLILKAYP